MLADNIRGLGTTKQTKPRPVAFVAPHPITPAGNASFQYKSFEYSNKSSIQRSPSDDTHYIQLYYTLIHWLLQAILQ